MLTKLLSHVPPGGRPYCEPYAGAASLFFAREPAPVEVLNDVDDGIVCVFRALQDREQFEELRHRLLWTPYARAEFQRALALRKDPPEDPVLRAWSTMVAFNFAVSGNPKTVGNWGRTFVSEGGVAGTANRWLMRQSLLDVWRWRLMRAQIDNRDAIEVLQYWDNEAAVFYCDPPYPAETRAPGERRVYRHEATDEHLQALVRVLLNMRGAVVLSGYRSQIFSPLEESGWKRVEFRTACHAAARNRTSGLQGSGSALKKVPRVECLWLNRRALALSRKKA